MNEMSGERLNRRRKRKVAKREEDKKGESCVEERVSLFLSLSLEDKEE